MSQSSKPVAVSYFKFAAKLQRAINRSKGSKGFTASSTSGLPTPSFSTPSQPTTPSFQHSNGRRLSFNQCLHQRSFSTSTSTSTTLITATTYNKLTHRRSEQFDSPLYSLQRRQTNDSSITPIHSSSSPTAKSSKLSRRSVPPSMYPNIHSINPIPSPAPTYSLLNRSNSLPANKQRRTSNTTQAVGSSLVQRHNEYWNTFNTSSSKVAPSDLSCTLSRSPRVSKQAFRTPSIESLRSKKIEYNSRCELSQQQSAGKLINTPPTSPSSSLDSYPGLDCGSSIPKTVGKTDKRSMNGCESNVPTKASVMIPTLTIPNRSSSSSSEKSNSSTAMPLTDSNMSIRSQMSESSLLSAAMVASGLPSVQEMKSQVDKSLGIDGQAQLVENVHLGVVSHISFVDTRLIVEPCSAVIETWAN